MATAVLPAKWLKGGLPTKPEPGGNDSNLVGGEIYCSDKGFIVAVGKN